MPMQRRLRFPIIVALVSLTVGTATLLFNGRWPQGELIQGQEAASDGPGIAQPPANLLIHESSPYLLQHAHNPVNWHPWGDEAFAKAKRENKPIFLSIGYSTCYWCHVMEVESFEDVEVAAVLNEHFVAIKVDREERPDIDEQYMIALQLLTERGGWPNSVWLTPDGKPWMAGTYFPKPQFVAALKQLNNLWHSRRADIDEQAESISAAVKRLREPRLAVNATLSSAMIDKGTQAILAEFDSEYAGFGDAPKFPPHATLRLLIQQHHLTSDDLLLKPINATLDAMWRGGIHDHIGGGFHRYATDAHWLLPHFEKMLYDNAQLMRSYADAFHITGDPIHREAVADIYQWLNREMTSPLGAFYSALDSGEVGKEGEAYVWTMEQLQDSLSADEAKIFAEVYHFEPSGNFSEESTGKRTGANIPHQAESLAAIAQRSNMPVDEFNKQLATLRDKLLAVRQSWPQPRKDDKILTSWNGLMIGSLARAGQVMDEPRYTQAAQRAADFILSNMVRDGKLLRSYRDGQAKLAGYLDDYAYFVQGLVELYRATGEDRWLEHAKRLASDMIDGFEDKRGGGFYFTTEDHEELLVRSKHLGGGGSIPNPNGTAALVLLELSALTDDASYRQAARRTLESLAEMIDSQPQASKDLLLATSLLLTTSETGDPGITQQKVAENVPHNEADTAQDASVRQAGPVSIRLSTSHSPVVVEEMFTLIVTLAIDDGWHLYAENPTADFLRPCEVKMSPSDSLTIGQIERPQAKRQMDSALNQILETYAGRIEFKIPITVIERCDSGETTLEVEVTVQACDASRCLPVETVTLQLPITVTERTER